MVNDVRTPERAKRDKPEDERKYRVKGRTWDVRVRRLNDIFEFVSGDTNHFITLDKDPHIGSFHPKLVRIARPPIEIKPLRARYYWGNESLDGYKPGDHQRIEIRTEEKLGKGYWEEVVKVGGDSGRTLRRGEFKEDVDGFGINLDLFSRQVREAAYDVLGEDSPIAPLVKLEGQSAPQLYQPRGCGEAVFEIKCDAGIGFTFDRRFEDELVEVEIEIKELPHGTTDRGERLLDGSEHALLAKFGDVLEPIYESKVSGLFRHLVSWRARDKKGFQRAFKALPRDRWAEYNVTKNVIA